MRILLTIMQSAYQDQTAEHTYESAGVHIEGNVYWDLFQEGNQDYQNGNTEAIWVAQMSLDLCQQGYTANRMAHSCNYSPVARDVQGELMGSLEDVGGEGVTAVSLAIIHVTSFMKINGRKI